MRTVTMRPSLAAFAVLAFGGVRGRAGALAGAARSAPGAPGGPDTVKSILEQGLEPPPGGYTYNPQGRRDPFVSLHKPVEANRGPGSRPPGVKGFLIQEVALKGIVKDKTGYIAILLGTDGKSYFVRVGERLFDGVITAIDAANSHLPAGSDGPLVPGEDPRRQEEPVSVRGGEVMRAKLAWALLITACVAPFVWDAALAQERTPTAISDIRQESTDRSTRLFVECTGPVAYTYYSPDPLTLVVDIPEVDASKVPRRDQRRDRGRSSPCASPAWRGRTGAASRASRCAWPASSPTRSTRRTRA